MAYPVFYITIEKYYYYPGRTKSSEHQCYLRNYRCYVFGQISKLLSFLFPDYEDENWKTIESLGAKLFLQIIVIDSGYVWQTRGITNMDTCDYVAISIWLSKTVETLRQLGVGMPSCRKKKFTEIWI